MAARWEQAPAVPGNFACIQGDAKRIFIERLSSMQRDSGTSQPKPVLAKITDYRNPSHLVLYSLFVAQTLGRRCAKADQYFDMAGQIHLPAPSMDRRSQHFQLSISLHPRTSFSQEVTVSITHSGVMNYMNVECDKPLGTASGQCRIGHNIPQQAE